MKRDALTLKYVVSTAFCILSSAKPTPTTDALGPLRLRDTYTTCETRNRTLASRLNTTGHSVSWVRYALPGHKPTQTMPLCSITDAAHSTTRDVRKARFICTRHSMTLYNVTVEDMGMYVLTDEYTGDAESFYFFIFSRAVCEAYATRCAFWKYLDNRCQTLKPAGTNPPPNDLRDWWLNISIHCAWIAGLLIIVASLVGFLLRLRRVGVQNAYRRLSNRDTEPLLQFDAYSE
ncbi:membrane glycoprotein RL11 [Panine betaherpesvirus 2]|uniref:Membrane glycoprotein RL11 n=1 Tax=Panine betaherpesvirus 2 TaxID=188763 RepID=Q8QS86_9BETA|nr:membrane glycoprotein RL11 [Panine betaherpesvirus 2]AAM00651.1 membrane glycoprotein RL11 [Panine betaherpesvirus 2]QXV67753.1 membrane glycoprotein RL11 [Panine betaherpesvirus 2]